MANGKGDSLGSTERDSTRNTRRDKPATSLAQIRPGTVIEGKYLVDRVLGRGGMGVVLAATHVELHKRVALKFLEVRNNEMPGDFEARFALEARVCAKLKNIHIARVHDVSVWQGKFPFMVMDYLEGDDLRNLRKKGERMPLLQAVDYVVQICEGLAEAHAQGIVHRDLKPANIFITKQQDGSDLVKVLDFGISKWASGAEGLGELTKAGEMLGSPKYMSPEQLGGGKIDSRADIWSIGAILYGMLTGRPPYDFAQVMQTFLAVASGAIPTTPSAIEPSIPAAVDAVILGCLTKDRERRIQNVAELAGALLDAVQSPFARRIRRQIASTLAPAELGSQPRVSTRPSPAPSIFKLAAAEQRAGTTRAPKARPRRAAKMDRARTWWGIGAAVAALTLATATGSCEAGAVSAVRPLTAAKQLVRP